jgi:hypothetical protein
MQTSDWIATIALVVAIATWLQTRSARVSDQRVSILKDQTALRMALDELARKIDLGALSRSRVAGMTGQRVAAEAFQAEAAADAGELRRLRARLASIPWISTARAAEDASVAVQEVRTRVEQLREKYAAAWADDEIQRQRRYDEMMARVNRSRDEPGGS